MEFRTLSLLALIFAAPIFPEIGETIKMQGTGEAIVGSNQSQDDVEEYAFIKAKIDAENKIGSYVESNIFTEQTENGKGVSDSTHKTIRGITGGILKLVDGTEVVKIKFVDTTNQALSILVTAQFYVDVDDYKKTLDSLASGNQQKEEFNRKIDSLNSAEKEISEVSDSGQTDPAKVSDVVSNYNKAQGSMFNDVVQLTGTVVANYIAPRASYPVQTTSYTDTRESYPVQEASYPVPRASNTYIKTGCQAIENGFLKYFCKVFSSH